MRKINRRQDINRHIIWALVSAFLVFIALVLWKFFESKSSFYSGNDELNNYETYVGWKTHIGDGHIFQYPPNWYENGNGSFESFPNGTSLEIGDFGLSSGCFDKKLMYGRKANHTDVQIYEYSGLNNNPCSARGEHYLVAEPIGISITHSENNKSEANDLMNAILDSYSTYDLSSVDVSDWKEFTNAEWHFSFSYPTKWKLEENKLEQIITLSDQNNQIVKIHYYDQDDARLGTFSSYDRHPPTNWLEGLKISNIKLGGDYILVNLIRKDGAESRVILLTSLYSYELKKTRFLILDFPKKVSIKSFLPEMLKFISTVRLSR